MAVKKITETPDFVKGLLKSADGVSELLNPNEMHPRDLLHKLRKGEKHLEGLLPDELQELGIYQARVVLMVLAVELALKYLWQQYNGTPAGGHHDIHTLFRCLSCSLCDKIQSEYRELAESPPTGWETLDEMFKCCKDASVKWRYLVEEPNFPDYVMQATYLKYATLSVLRVSEKLAQKE